MFLRLTLILLTVVSVVADTLILPFYPQFFESEFEVESGLYVGVYIATCSFTVMVTFPFWALLAKRVNEMHIWVVTQLISACLGYLTYCADSIVQFWVYSQLMLVFKASYLLIYPFFLKLEEKHKHLGVVGLFALLMHFSAIGGAVLGGVALDFYRPRDIYLIMIGSDILQTVICLMLICMYQFQWRQPQSPTADKHKHKYIKRHVVFIGLVFLFLYFSSFLMRPFFTRMWEGVMPDGSDVVSGLVYSIPAWVALLGVFVNKCLNPKSKQLIILVSSFILASLGAVLQSLHDPSVILLGRLIFGWAMFQLTVRLELLIFSFSQESDYAFDFSIVSLFQNTGVIIASFATGYFVEYFYIELPFHISAFGFLITLIIFYYLLSNQVKKTDISYV